jgi:hypothetical protein
MIRSTLLLVFGLLSVSACKKKQEPELTPIPVASAPAPAQVASEAAAPDPIAPASGPAGSAAPPPTAAPPQQPARRESIDACCAALAAYKGSGRPKKVKDQAETGARVCRGAAPLVRDGKTSRQAALAQIRAASPGVNAPECQ